LFYFNGLELSFSIKQTNAVQILTTLWVLWKVVKRFTYKSY